jgi:hypothetical protein
VAPACTLALGGNAGGLAIRAHCDRAVTLSVSGTATIAKKRKRRARRAAAKRARLATRTVTLGAGQTAKVKLALPRAVVSAVKHHGRVAVVIVATARTTDGAQANKTATIAKLRAAPKRKRRSKR